MNISSGLIRVMARSVQCLIMANALISEMLTFKGSICGNVMAPTIRYGWQFRWVSEKDDIKASSVTFYFYMFNCATPLMSCREHKRSSRPAKLTLWRVMSAEVYKRL
mmetsp:Transcript_1598/g.2020  ORF Transcript_1598/g.2020 Transcript_1598/m.2020 type:complete len:107 (+) Transcript_1598:1742-2062(+)